MKRIFGLPLESIQRATVDLSDGSPSDDAVTVFARASWSRICEPGDRVAGSLIGELGPIGALNLLIAIHRSDHSALDRFVPREQQQHLAAHAERWLPRLDSQAVFQDLTNARTLGIRLLVPESHWWPQQLTALGDHAPLALWIRGDGTLFEKPALAVVGARASTSYGEHVTAEIVSSVASRGVPVVSGGAFGIDGVAHRVCLATEAPTVAVLAGGVDRLYPSGHATLLRQIAERGILCAEQPPGSSPTRWRFLQRNRLIAALGAATVVCEAGFRSGSLNTAAHAVELARPLGAVPGPVTSASSAGCHRLLREFDAVCVRNGNDALELMGERTPNDIRSRSVELPAACVRVRDAIPLRRALAPEEVANRAGTSLRETKDALIELELHGLVAQTSEGWRRVSARERAAR